MARSVRPVLYSLRGMRRTLKKWQSDEASEPSPLLTTTNDRDRPSQRAGGRDTTQHISLRAHEFVGADRAHRLPKTRSLAHTWLRLGQTDSELHLANDAIIRPRPSRLARTGPFQGSTKSYFYSPIYMCRTNCVYRPNILYAFLHICLIDG